MGGDVEKTVLLYNGLKRVDLLNNVMCDVEHNDDTVHFVAEKFEIFTLKIIAK